MRLYIKKIRGDGGLKEGWGGGGARNMNTLTEIWTKAWRGLVVNTFITGSI